MQGCGTGGRIGTQGKSRSLLAAGGYLHQAKLRRYDCRCGSQVLDSWHTVFIIVHAGLRARGGGRGPDLTRARKRHGDSDGDPFRNISQGIPGTVMPTNGTNGQGVGMTDEEIWQIITY